MKYLARPSNPIAHPAVLSTAQRNQEQVLAPGATIQEKLLSSQESLGAAVHVPLFTTIKICGFSHCVCMVTSNWMLNKKKSLASKQSKWEMAYSSLSLVCPPPPPLPPPPTPPSLPHVYEYDCFMHVRMCTYCICMYVMTMYSVVRITLVSNCAI